ncbi:MAG: hypothetical protein AAF264_05215, partial [Pseudomonadota bacterium]
MTDTAKPLATASAALQTLCTFLLALAGLGLVIASGAAALGAVPWLELPLAIGDEVVEDAGMWAQLGV